MRDLEDQLPTTQSSRRAEQIAGPSINAQNGHVQAENGSQEPPIDQNIPPPPVHPIWGTIPEKRKPEDYTLPWFYWLPEPTPVSNVLLLKPRTIIFLNYVVRATFLGPVIVLFPLALCPISFLEIILAPFLREWPSVTRIVSFIRFYFDMPRVIWVGTFRIILCSITEKCLILISPQTTFFFGDIPSRE